MLSCIFSTFPPYLPESAIRAFQVISPCARLDPYCGESDGLDMGDCPLGLGAADARFD
jgi:hypothetical protein